MEVVNEVMPTSRERLEQMMEPGPDGPIYMVNLLSFKEHAEYEDGRETDLTGREAYNLYGQAVSGLIQDYGGEIVFVGDVTFLSLGQVEDLWDEVAIAKYPNRGALLAMSTSDGVAGGRGGAPHGRPRRPAQHRDGRRRIRVTRSAGRDHAHPGTCPASMPMPAEQRIRAGGHRGCRDRPSLHRRSRQLRRRQRHRRAGPARRGERSRARGSASTWGCSSSRPAPPNGRRPPDRDVGRAGSRPGHHRCRRRRGGPPRIRGVRGRPGDPWSPDRCRTRSSYDACSPVRRSMATASSSRFEQAPDPPGRRSSPGPVRGRWPQQRRPAPRRSPTAMVGWGRGARSDRFVGRDRSSWRN